MTIAVVSTKNATSSATNFTTASITGITATGAGNKLVLAFNSYGGMRNISSITDNIGNSWSLSGSHYIGTDITSEIWQSPSAGAGVTTLNITFSGTVLFGYDYGFYELSGANTNTAIDSSTGNPSITGTGTTVPSQPLTTTHSGSIIIVTVAYNGGTASSVSSPYTAIGFPNGTTHAYHITTTPVTSEVCTTTGTGFSGPFTTSTAAFLIFTVGPNFDALLLAGD